MRFRSILLTTVVQYLFRVSAEESHRTRPPTTAEITLPDSTKVINPGLNDLITNEWNAGRLCYCPQEVTCPLNANGIPLFFPCVQWSCTKYQIDLSGVYYALTADFQVRLHEPLALNYITYHANEILVLRLQHRRHKMCARSRWWLCEHR